MNKVEPSRFMRRSGAMIVDLPITIQRSTLPARMTGADAKSESFSLQNGIRILKSRFGSEAMVAVAQW